LRKYFVTGILVLLPLLITVYVMVFAFNLVDGSLRNLVFTYTHHKIPGIGLLTFILLIFLTGVFAQNVVGRKLLHWGDVVLRHIPVAKSIYSASKQVMEVVASDRSEAFQKVVLVEYPRRGIYMFGFLTGEAPPPVRNRVEKSLDLVNILVPATPPGHGYLILVPRQDVLVLDMSVEEGLKLVLSGGIIASSPSYRNQMSGPSPDGDISRRKPGGHD
jgi:uncharacterized membrane protein